MLIAKNLLQHYIRAKIPRKTISLLQYIAQLRQLIDKTLDNPLHLNSKAEAVTFFLRCNEIKRFSKQIYLIYINEFRTDQISRTVPGQIDLHGDVSIHERHIPKRSSDPVDVKRSKNVNGIRLKPLQSSCNCHYR